MTGENTNMENGQISFKIYGTDTGKVIGAVYDITAETPELLSYFEEMISEVYGERGQLPLNALGDFAELAGESAHLENGQDMWRYTYPEQEESNPDNNAANNSVISGSAIMTLQVTDGHAYIAEYLDLNNLTVSGTGRPINVEGFDKLGPNEQIAVRLYAEYLETQYNAALQQYVNYFLDKNKQENAPSTGIE